MAESNSLLTFLGLLVVVAPGLLLAVFFATFLANHRMQEQTINRFIHGTLTVSLLSALTAGVLMLKHGWPQYTIDLGDWIITPNYHLKFQFILDLLSLSYATLTLILCATIGAFSTRYLHRERGYNQFFVLFAVFLVGMLIAALSGTVETLFAGWELVGIASVLLIAFFQDHPAPPRNGLRVWVIFRICDAALMLAAILMHEINGAGDFQHLVGDHAWPQHDPLLIGPHFALLGLLFVIAAAGKSALIPFCGWLPRAMEGPTPASAAFFGALSVHLGIFLLLRVSPVLDSSPWLSALVVILGLGTAALAYLAGRVQTDIKAALAFASLIQIGLIIAEIGLGFRYLALVHLLGHACMRTLQFIRAPSLLNDHHQLENAIGSRPREERPQWEQRLPESARLWLYRFSLERGYLDSLLDRFVARPFVILFRGFDTLERRWARLLEGNASVAANPADSQKQRP